MGANVSKSKQDEKKQDEKPKDDSTANKEAEAADTAWAASAAEGEPLSSEAKAKEEEEAKAKAAAEAAAKEEEIKQRRLRIHSSSSYINADITEDIDHAEEDRSLRDTPSRANMHTRGLKHANVWDFYKRGRVVGKGMCGNVYAGRHHKTGMRVAVKSVRKCNVKPKMYQDLLKEIDLLMTLDHPNVVKMVEAFDDDDNIYLVTELCEGGELYKHLISEGYYDEERAAEVFRMMVSAIRYCHRAGICSRDLKLENFVFQSKAKDAPLKLLDFGLACRFGRGLGRMQSMVGTPYYVAPEILYLADKKTTHYTQKCDIWSLGIILYMLLSGTPPFSAKDTQGILRKIKKMDVAFPEQLFGDVSDEAKDLCARLLLKDPELRIPIEQVALHPWLKFEGTKQRGVNLTVVKQLKKFTDYCHMQKTAIDVMSVLLSDKQVAHLRDEFQQMDKDGTGTISLSEFAAALAGEVQDKDQVQRIFQHVDRNGSGEISYSEFIAASVHHSVFSNEKHLRAAYDQLVDKEVGGIPMEKLEHLLSENLSDEEVARILETIDKNADGVVCWDEYLTVMKASVDEKLSDDELQAERELLQLHDSLSVGLVDGS